MQLWIGPPGSGKTSAVLADLLPAVRAGRSRWALLAPTHSIANHYRKRLLGPGGAIRPECVTTLSEFIRPFAKDVPGISAPALHLLVDRVVAELSPASFEAVQKHAGFRRSLVGALQEMFGAEATAERLDQLAGMGVLEGPIVNDFLEVFANVEMELLSRSQGMRSHRLDAAAQFILEQGWRDGDRLYFDGFTALTGLELDLIDALTARDIQVTVTMPETILAEETCKALARKGFEVRWFTGGRATRRQVVVPAPTLAQEVNEIARRVLEAHQSGRPWHDMMVLVRQPSTYAPLLRNAFARFGIPGAFHFGSTLSEQPAVRYLTRLMDALLHQWDHERLLSAWEMTASGRGGTMQGDVALNKLRHTLPGRGIPAPDEQGLAALSGWLSETETPGEWARRLRELIARLWPAPEALPQSLAEAERHRQQAAVRKACDDALAAVGTLLPQDETLPFAPFWRAAQTVLEVTPWTEGRLRPDGVQVMTVSEAREREAPLVFVAGLIEGQFPAEPRQEPLLSDALRLELRQYRLRLPTLADQQEQESWLLQVAFSRATDELVLTYPQYKSNGDKLMPSFVLADRPIPKESSHPIRPKPNRPKAFLRVPGIYDEHLREQVRKRHLVLFPTAIESFLQCRFQFFARHTLKLEQPPPSMSDRLDFPAQGSFVHHVLKTWHKQPDLEAYFDAEFRSFCEDQRVSMGYVTERLRANLWRDLQMFVEAQDQRPADDTLTEEVFNLPLGDVTIKGVLDRCDVHDGRATVYDYKYSGKAGVVKRTEEESHTRYVQGGLYLLAARLHWEPAAFYYYGLRGEITKRGWDTPERVQELMIQARDTTLTVIEEIRAGRIDVQPADADACRYCEFAIACRIRSAGKAQTQDA